MNCAHTRFTTARAKYGLSGFVIQSASASLRENFGFGGILLAAKRSSLKSFGNAGSASSSPSRNFGFTGSPLSPGFASFTGPVKRMSPLFRSPIA